MDEKGTNELAQFFKEEYQALKNYVRSKIDDTTEGDAGDIVQDVALRMFSRNRTAMDIDNVAAFVYRAVRNKVIDVLRRKKGKHAVLEDSAGEWNTWKEDESMGTGYPEHLVERLGKALESLAPEYRDIIIAVDYEGSSYREVSERTGIPVGTLMSHRHRALARLSKKLK